MGLKKGQTGNPAGRPKGTPNKVTIEMKTWLSGLIEKNRRQMERDLKQLEPKERLIILEKLMQYTVPKMQSVTSQIDYSRLSDEQLDTVINELTKDLDNDNTD
jgi:uncharacterized protein (UPF0305 family)